MRNTAYSRCCSAAIASWIAAVTASKGALANMLAGYTLLPHLGCRMICSVANAPCQQLFTASSSARAACAGACTHLAAARVLRAVAQQRRQCLNLSIHSVRATVHHGQPAAGIYVVGPVSRCCQPLAHRLGKLHKLQRSRSSEPWSVTGGGRAAKQERWLAPCCTRAPGRAPPHTHALQQPILLVLNLLPHLHEVYLRWVHSTLGAWCRLQLGLHGCSSRHVTAPASIGRSG